MQNAGHSHPQACAISQPAIAATGPAKNADVMYSASFPVSA